MSLIDLNHGLGFVHVQKTGGAAIKNALRSATDRYIASSAHDPASYLAEHYAEHWRPAYKVAFVRNPWDWWVSAYHWWDFVSQYRSFAEFLRCHQQWRGSLPWGGYGPMLDDAEGRCLVDHVARYEDLGGEFQAICRAVGMEPPALEIANATRHCPWRQYYEEDPDLVEIVRRLSAPDIARFGYRFHP